jgi:hypothetical protein
VSSLCFFKRNLYRLRRGGTYRVINAEEADATCDVEGDAFACDVSWSSGDEGEQVGKVLVNRSTYQVKPFYLSSETVLPIK